MSEIPPRAEITGLHFRGEGPERSGVAHATLEDPGCLSDRHGDRGKPPRGVTDVVGVHKRLKGRSERETGWR